MKKNVYYWLEAEVPAAQQAPASDPYSAAQGGQVPEQQPAQIPDAGQDPSAAAQNQQPEDDVTQDPQSIQTPQNNENQDYEQWRHDFMELAIKCENEEMISALHTVRDNELEPAQRKFVEDNIQIFLFRRDNSVQEASKKVRSMIKQELDQTNPGTVVMQHLLASLDAQPLLYQGLIKLAGTFAWKADLHRKWIAAMLGAVQVGGGGENKDIVYCGKDYDINISTRMATQWGEINIGKWSLLDGDPKKFLKPDEIDELEEGSPEKKQVLRREIIIKSIAETYRKRAFLINVVDPDGTVYALGWDLGNSLLDAYKEGKVVVRGKENEDKEILISDNGDIIPVIDYSLLYVKETGEVDDDGRPETEEVPFITRRDGTLYLVCDLDTLKNATAGMSGVFFKTIPYNGNPSDVLELQRSVPNMFEIINKQVL